MTLSELVQLRNAFEKALQLETIKKELDQNISRLSELSTTVPSTIFDTRIRNLISQHSLIYDSIRYDSEINEKVLEEINSAIKDLAKDFFTENYATEHLLTDPKTIRELRQLSIDDTIADFLLSRIRLYSTWKYPALEIGCRDGEWTKHLVGSDPLYISDSFQEFLNSTNEKFTPEYQARLRKYLIRDSRIFNLPKNQFSLIFSFNYFNYLSLDSIKQLLTQAMTWLRPGGTIIFTYNNADLPIPARLVENYTMTYVPKRMLIPLVESLGFTVISTEDFDPNISWVELQKPGVLKTVKAHQTLGEIKYR